MSLTRSLEEQRAQKQTHSPRDSADQRLPLRPGGHGARGARVRCARLCGIPPEPSNGTLRAFALTKPAQT